MATLDVIVGSWDEISEHMEMLADRQVRVIVLPKPQEGKNEGVHPDRDETDRLLEELGDIGTDAPAWPEECCARDPAETD
jgi:hypothetical protein